MFVPVLGLSYILNEQGEPVAEPEMVKWAEWMGTAKRQVAEDILGPVRVSTVFMGMDCDFHFGPPILWETMIFAPPDTDLYGYQKRYASRREALAGHAAAVALALTTLLGD